MKEIRKEIFRAYDIRGVVDQDFDEEWVERLGRACGTWFRSKGWDRAVLGHDCRHSSPVYQQAVGRGLNASGVDVLFLNLIPTPALYFAAKKLNYKAGVMITASHNPPEYNGFKVWGGETTIHTDDIQEIYNIMESGNFAEGSGVASYHDIVPYYIEDLLSDIKLERPVKVVLDGGNGAGGILLWNCFVRQEQKSFRNTVSRTEISPTITQIRLLPSIWVICSRPLWITVLKLVSDLTAMLTASGLLMNMATLFPETGLWLFMPGKCLNASPVKS